MKNAVVIEGVSFDSDLIENLGGDDEESFSRTSTVLSGFDYGFSCRSDGAYSSLSGGLKDAKG